ncbi:hypothetical protein [Salinibacterium sp. TMP30]|uniref:hypothetical protein n=1 Tax=Salinibacterium sp. TMP30 TaxID=3138237 RepID=UPI00313911B1
MRAGRTDNASPSSLYRRWSVAAAATLFAIVAFIPAAGAAASTGSIPPDVSAFAMADDGLILELEEYFGVDQRGDGLDFSEGIELGEIDRIFLWSDAYHSGQSIETPVQYVNRWKVPVLIGDEPVGIAMIGIDPATVEPEMIDFIRSPGIALALDDINTDATLVFEPETGAWFSLSDGSIIPLVRGDSGIAEETTLAQYQPMLTTRVVDVVEPTPQPDQGSVQSVVLIATTAVVLLLALLVPTIIGQVRERRARQAAGEGEGEGETATDVHDDVKHDDVKHDAEPHNAESRDAESRNAEPTVTDVAADTAAPEVPATPDVDAAAVAPAETTATEPGTAAKPVDEEKVATAKSPAAKPATPKKAPAKKTPATTKPATTKPATTKPATTKPATKKPATSTSATKKPVSSPSAGAKPLAKKPAPKKPAPKKPAASKPAPAKPVASESPSATESSVD